jgi:hypothetical protein
MKQLISNYTFIPQSKQVVLTDYTTINLERLLLITNVTKNIIIYNFADPLTGAVVDGNVVLLNADTTQMPNTDKLQIFYDTVNENATEASLVLLQEQNILLRRLLKISDSLATVDTAQRQRVTLDVLPSNIATNLGRIALLDSSWGIWVHSMFGNSFSCHSAIPDVYRTIDTARMAYATGIRSNLNFS